MIGAGQPGSGDSFEACLVDVTRLISRAGRSLTGVDRVELAYLDRLTRRRGGAYAIARSSLGYVLLAPDGTRALLDRLAGDRDWGAADRLSRLSRKKTADVQRAESDLRRLRQARCRPRFLPRMLARAFPNGVTYFNVGHSNLTDRMLNAVKVGANGRIAVLIHDVIPLDYPQFQRPGTPERFRGILRRVRSYADLIIYNSHDTRARAEAVMSEWGPPPAGSVAHLGVPRPVPGPIPDHIRPSDPYFVVLGTIEPRKGHAMLLDIWEKLGSDAPQLLICGARGWNNEAVFKKLDALPPDSPVREYNGLSDAEIAGLLAGARALLFPSRAEGYGLPPMEAAALGTPILCSELPSVREVLGDLPVYLRETDCYLWLDSIQSLLKGQGHYSKAQHQPALHLPSWDEHFEVVLSAL
jgi:glycosyltransferase involved in cell wall biosynthesis